MAEIVAAESSKKRTKKTLDHIELHPKMGGGVRVKHVYSDYQHEPKEVEFNEKGKAQGGEHIVSHLDKHGALPGLENYDKQDESETDEEIKD